MITCKTSFVAAVGAFCLWEKNGQPFRESSNVQYGKEIISDDSMKLQLKISNVQREDAGRYSLFSTNLFGHANSKASTVIVDAV